MTERIKEVLRNNNVSVISLLEQLCTISAIKIKKVPLFDEDVFEKIETIDELWRKLRKYWDIFDYDILIFVVELTECTEAQEIFNSFLARIDPSAFEDMDLVLHCKVYQEEELMRPFLRIKVNAEMCTFDIKRQVKEIVSKKFNLEKYSLRLNSIKDGCIEFTFNISKAVMSYVLEYHITGNIIANFARYNIISPQVNEMTLNIPSEIVDMVSVLLCLPAVIQTQMHLYIFSRIKHFCGLKNCWNQLKTWTQVSIVNCICPNAFICTPVMHNHAL